jgi:hypothetical protein
MEHYADHHDLCSKHVPRQCQALNHAIKRLIGVFHPKMPRKRLCKCKQFLIELYHLSVSASPVQLLKVIGDPAGKTGETTSEDDECGTCRFCEGPGFW